MSHCYDCHMDGTSDILAVAITLAPVAFAAWLTKSRALFVAGAIGAVVGLLFAASFQVEFDGDATVRDRMIAFTLSKMEGTLAGAAIALTGGWLVDRLCPPTRISDK